MSTVTEGQVVLIHYTLKNDQGDVLDSSSGGDPLPYLHGAGNIVPGLENALTGKSVGDEVEVVVPPDQGYGLRDPAAVQEVPRGEFPPDVEIEPGAQFVMQGDGGETMPVWVIAVAEDRVTLDANHPLAGQALHFSISIESTREPTAEEKTHGHPHGLTGNEGHH